MSLASRSTAPLRPLDDIGNGLRLADVYGQEIRYTEDTKWLVWDGRRWGRVGELPVRERAHVVARKIAREAKLRFCSSDEPAAPAAEGDKKKKKRLSEEERAFWKHCQHSVSSRGITNMLKEAAPYMLDEFLFYDVDPWLFNTASGTLDLRTGELREHSRNDRLTKYSPVVYDPAAECPRWDQFLMEIFDEDETLVGFMRRWFGYCLTGRTDEDVMLVLHGTGSNGKSTLLEVVMKVMGEYAQTGQSASFMCSDRPGVRDDLAHMIGARLVSAFESSSGARLDEGMVKQMTGGDPIRCRHLFAREVEFKPAFRIVLSTNHEPVIVGTDLGIWRRVLKVPFVVCVPPERRDKTLPDKLDSESSGILNWMLAGLREWQEHGLMIPERIRLATEDYRRSCDLLAPFLDEWCWTNSNAPEGKLVESSASLYKAYIRHCVQEGSKPLQMTTFGKRMIDKGFRRVLKGTARTAHYEGVALREEVRSQVASMPSGMDWLNK